ncbi:MAG: hypothetical protein HY541_08695 [Deltaproteobacteria bacterium]|nr:hypothetical protein [Deltaproteobacteria bacterium]
MGHMRLNRCKMSYWFLLLFVCLSSCSKFSCQPPPKPVAVVRQPSWFDPAVDPETRLKRLFYLLPPDMEMILSANPENLFQETALKPLTDFLFSLPPFNGQNFMNLAGQKFLAGMIRTDGGPALIGLAAGPYRHEEILKNLEKTAELSGTRLTELRTGKIPIYVLQEDAVWGVAFPSDELLLVGNAGMITPTAEKYLERAPPTDSDLEALSAFQNIDSPLFFRLRVPEDSRPDIREIEALIRLENEWELAVKFVCVDEKKAKHLKEYLSANQIMGAQIPKAVSDLTKFFLKAAMEQKGAELVIKWQIRDIPWEALTGVLTKAMQPASDS